MIAQACRQAREEGRPLIWGHRGAMAWAPQNTLASFQRALEAGADGIELDVQLSRDGVPVVIHDATVDATTDGRGRVDSFLLKELKKLDAGSWFSPPFRHERIPTLEEVLSTLGQKLFINIELKYDFPQDGLAIAWRNRILGPRRLGVQELERWQKAVLPLVEKVSALVKGFQLEHRVLFSSFNVQALAAVAQVLPQVPRGFLWSPDVDTDTPSQITSVELQTYHPYFKTLTQDQVDEVHRDSLMIHTWTVNSESDMVRLNRMGVDGLITNDPALFFRCWEKN